MAQEAERRVRVGWLGSGRRVMPVGRAEFRQGLRDYGLTVASEDGYAPGQVRRLPRLAAELVDEKKVDILVVRDSAAAQAARQATTTVPIIRAGVGDPVQLVFALKFFPGSEAP